MGLDENVFYTISSVLNFRLLHIYLNNLKVAANSFQLKMPRKPEK